MLAPSVFTSQDLESFDSPISCLANLLVDKVKVKFKKQLRKDDFFLTDRHPGTPKIKFIN